MYCTKDLLTPAKYSDFTSRESDTEELSAGHGEETMRIKQGPKVVA
jgi:hypothetical protein